MAKNLMPEVAALLGVEISEEFMANDRGVNVLCGIYEDGLCKLNHDGSKRPGFGDDLLGKILRGKSEIVKLPWEPKYEDRFFTYIHNEAHTEWLVEWYYWYGTPAQLAAKQIGMVFKTREDAEKALPEVYEKLTGQKWEV